jgi:hypothetical protein
MNPNSAGTAETPRSPMARALTLGIFAALLTIASAREAFAAARAPDVDPLRERVGQIVYPRGVHPVPDKAGGTKPVLAKDKTGKSAQDGKKRSSPKDTDNDKSDE